MLCTADGATERKFCAAAGHTRKSADAAKQTAGKNCREKLPGETAGKLRENCGKTAGENKNGTVKTVPPKHYDFEGFVRPN